MVKTVVPIGRCCTTLLECQSPTSRHVKMLGTWDVAKFCPLVLKLLPTCRQQCSCSGVWHYHTRRSDGCHKTHLRLLRGIVARRCLPAINFAPTDNDSPTPSTPVDAVVAAAVVRDTCITAAAAAAAAAAVVSVSKHSLTGWCVNRLLSCCAILTADICDGRPLCHRGTTIRFCVVFIVVIIIFWSTRTKPVGNYYYCIFSKHSFSAVSAPISLKLRHTT